MLGGGTAEQLSDSECDYRVIRQAIILLFDSSTVEHTKLKEFYSFVLFTTTSGFL